jgi:hypothetical protein
MHSKLSTESAQADAQIEFPVFDMGFQLEHCMKENAADSSEKGTRSVPINLLEDKSTSFRKGIFIQNDGTVPAETQYVMSQLNAAAQ